MPIEEQMRDPRVSLVEWRDLLPLSRGEVCVELALSLPWLVGSWWFAARGWYPAALACSFVFFLTGLRQVHGAFHYAIGLPRRSTEVVIAALSLLMLGSMHAVQLTHLLHHRHCLDDDDVEAASARMPAWRAIVTGPLFPLRLHAAALRRATARQRRWIIVELIANGALLAIAFMALEWGWLRYHIAAMIAGHCLSPFFAVWTVHHDCERDGIFARTIRGALRSRLTYEMFYHVEHHLFPGVPTRRLPALAKRLDAVAPDLTERRVF
jgi:fatty acid desaturase